MLKKKKIQSKEEKDKQSAIDHLYRLGTAILFGNGSPIFKEHWCEEHQKYEY